MSLTAKLFRPVQVPVWLTVFFLLALLVTVVRLIAHNSLLVIGITLAVLVIYIGGSLWMARREHPKTTALADKELGATAADSRNFSEHFARSLPLIRYPLVIVVITSLGCIPGSPSIFSLTCFSDPPAKSLSQGFRP